MSRARTLFAFIASYVLMFIGGLIPIVGPFAIGVIGGLLARGGALLGALIGVSAYYLCLLTLMALHSVSSASAILLALILGSLNAFMAGSGGYLGGWFFERLK